MLHSPQFDFPGNICKIHSTTLRKTEYRVQTTLGTSQSHYKHSSTSPIHGTDQGSESSGTHWVYIGVPMTSSLEKQNKGCTILSPDNSIKWKKTIIGFVDDKRQYTNDWKINSLFTAANKLQSVAQTWDTYLVLVENLNCENSRGIASVGRLTPMVHPS